jgi:predicted phage terminase large subunit-like protein
MTDECVRFATADTAYTTSTWSDYSVFAVWDWHRATQTLFLIDVMRERVESPELESWLRRCAARHAVKFVGIEDQTSGKALIQQIQRHGGLTIRPLKADKDKIARALPYAQAVGNGQVLLPTVGSWVSEWMEEHSPFPYGKHDDMVDAGAYAWRVCQDMPHHDVEERFAVDTSLEARIQRQHEALDAKAERKNRPRHGLSGRLGR